MIRIVSRKPDRYSPRVFCDHCSREIGDASQGNYEWEVDPGTGQPVTGEIKHVHKACSEEYELRQTGEWQAIELSELPIRIGYNLGQTETRRARVLERMKNSL